MGENGDDEGQQNQQKGSVNKKLLLTWNETKSNASSLRGDNVTRKDEGTNWGNSITVQKQGVDKQTDCLDKRSGERIDGDKKGNILTDIDITINENKSKDIDSRDKDENINELNEKGWDIMWIDGSSENKNIIIREERKTEILGINERNIK